MLIAHSLIDSKTKQLTTMIANISNSSVQLRKFQQIAHLEEVEIDEKVRDRSDQQELEMTQTNDNIQSRDEYITSVHSNIAKLDIDFQPFNDEEVSGIAKTLLRNQDLFDRLSMVQLRVCIIE